MYTQEEGGEEQTQEEDQDTLTDQDQQNQTQDNFFEPSQPRQDHNEEEEEP